MKTSEVAYFHLDDWDSWTVSKPTINAEVTFSVPGGNFRLRVMPDEALINYFDSLVNESVGTIQIRINGALLPGQGVDIEWEPFDEVTQRDKDSGTQ